MPGKTGKYSGRRRVKSLVQLHGGVGGSQAVPRRAGQFLSGSELSQQSAQQAFNLNSLAQQSLTFLVPGTGFVEDNLSMDLGWGMVSG